MSATHDETAMLNRLSSEINALIGQMQRTTGQARLDIKDYKKLDKEFKEKCKLFGILEMVIATRISDKNKD